MTRAVNTTNQQHWLTFSSITHAVLDAGLFTWESKTTGQNPPRPSPRTSANKQKLIIDVQYDAKRVIGVF